MPCRFEQNSLRAYIQLKRPSLGSLRLELSKRQRQANIKGNIYLIIEGGRMSQQNLPILDFAKFRQGGEAKAEFIAELADVTHNIGFFYLKNHGIEQSLLDRALELSKQFFNLPLEEKLEIQMVNTRHFRGYTKLKDEITREKPDSREQLDYMPEYEAIPLDEIPIDQPWLRIQGPNQWPKSIPELKTTLLDLQSQQVELAKLLVTAFAESLGQSPDAFAHTYSTNPSVLCKAIHYPGTESAEQGVGVHKDGGYLTLLMQDDVTGLEVLKDDEWVVAEPIRGTFIVNIGELLEIASQGYLKATLHRVTTPPKGVDRFALAFFLTSQLNATVPLINLPDHLKSKNFEVTKDPKNPLFTEIGKNFLKGRQRSHPDVAARHYSDLPPLV